MDTKAGSFFYNVDVCDWDALNMPSWAQTANGYKFTLRTIASALPMPNHGGGNPVRPRVRSNGPNVPGTQVPDPLTTSTLAFDAAGFITDAGSASKVRAPLPGATPAQFSVEFVDSSARVAVVVPPSHFPVSDGVTSDNTERQLVADLLGTFHARTVAGIGGDTIDGQYEFGSLDAWYLADLR